MLKVGPLAISASVMPQLFAGTSHAAISPLPTAKAKSVIFLWMGGGVTHIDSLDPKPEAPEQIRGTLSAIPTALPGVQFSEVCPNLARIANDLCTVRSFSHDSDDHLLSQVYTLSGRKVTQAQLFTEPNIGAVVQYLLGPRNGLPGYIAVPGITRPEPPRTRPRPRKTDRRSACLNCATETESTCSFQRRVVDLVATRHDCSGSPLLKRWSWMRDKASLRTGHEFMPVSGLRTGDGHQIFRRGMSERKRLSMKGDESPHHGFRSVFAIANDGPAA